jgi:hypothetical protein
MQVERDVSKFLILGLYAAILVDILTHGTEFAKVTNALGSIIKTTYQAAAGQTIR